MYFYLILCLSFCLCVTNPSMKVEMHLNFIMQQNFIKANVFRLIYSLFDTVNLHCTRAKFEQQRHAQHIKSCAYL